MQNRIALAAITGMALLALGCDVKYVKWSEMPSDPVELKELVSQLEIETQQQEAELAIAKESRDIVAGIAEKATGWLDRDSSMKKLSRANSRVESANWMLSRHRERLALAKAKLSEQH